MLLLSFLSFASPCLLTFALWSIKLQDGKGDDLISSVYSGKLPCSTLCLECIYSKCIPLSGYYPKVRQSQPCSSGQRPEHTYHLEAFFLLLTPRPQPWRFWFSNSVVHSGHVYFQNAPQVILLSSSSILLPSEELLLVMVSRKPLSHWPLVSITGAAKNCTVDHSLRIMIMAANTYS